MKCEVIDVPQNDPCQMCNPCIRMRMMEIGILAGAVLNVEEKMNGMYIVEILSENESVEQTFAMRKEELERICYKLK